MTTIENLLEENARLQSLLYDWVRVYEQQSIQLKLSRNDAYEWEKRFIELERVSTAAPELLSALREIQARIQGVWDDPDLKNFGPLMESTSSDVIDIARAAIAKATQP